MGMFRCLSTCFVSNEVLQLETVWEHHSLRILLSMTVLVLLSYLPFLDVHSLFLLSSLRKHTELLLVVRRA